MLDIYILKIEINKNKTLNERFFQVLEYKKSLLIRSDWQIKIIKKIIIIKQTKLFISIYV